MLKSHPFHDIGRLPAPSDNVAIASRKLVAGMLVTYGKDTFTLDFTILEGHRFAVQQIEAGEALLSWGLPFGIATRRILPGSYVCNASIIEALQGRTIDFEVPQQPNFRDQIEPYTLHERQFQPGQQVPRYTESRTFMGYRRGPTRGVGTRKTRGVGTRKTRGVGTRKTRGVGTRNMILILGTTSRTASYARMLETRLQGVAADFPNIDGIVAISHTEGSGREPLNNQELLLRTLAGLMVHANVGAVLAVDDGPDQITNDVLQQYMTSHHYPLCDVTHHFMTLKGHFEADLEAGEAIIKNWLEMVNSVPRTSESVAHLKIALQCGGSDAFSGVSGNPLAGSIAREVIRYGGSANLAETDELIGAEAYILQNARDLDTARAFLDTIANFKERLSWHGMTAEGNPSGGNRYRGLYNIVLKSIGAAMKRHPEVRLDYVADYSQRMEQPGFYFMNTPGNDLESIAGQVGGGSNMILFVTGNGSITNFPLVPTIKIMTTTGRYAMLPEEMDINAGAYQDGMAMDDLTQQSLDLTIAVASGQRSAGERAGHAQVSIWRNWRQTDTSQIKRLVTTPKPSGQPIPISTRNRIEKEYRFQAMKTGGRYVTDQVGLILPTSLCSGQIGRISADRLNQMKLGQPLQVSRYVTLTHTEGCGFAVHTAEDIFDRTMISYMTHPLVRFGLFLEHGCEKTHNDHMRLQLEERHLDPEHFGWASIQLDGGIQKTLKSIEAWFEASLKSTVDLIRETVGIEHLSLGLLSAGPIPEQVAGCLAQVTRTVVGAGGTIVIPHSDALLASAAYQKETISSQPIAPSLAYGQQVQEKGFHVMETPSEHWVETVSGLGATGVEVMLAIIDGRPMQGHPFIPLIQMTAAMIQQQADFDLVLDGDDSRWAEDVLHLVTQVASREVKPKLLSQGNIDFQITRGLLGVST